MNYSIRCIKDNPTGMEAESIIPDKFKLMKNFPNPFNPTTIIQFETTHNTFISLKVFNVLGNEIATLINEERPVGSYSCEWNAGGFPSGVYFYSLTTRDFRETKKMILMK